MGGEIAPTADTVVELVRQQAARCGEKVAFSFSHCGDGRDGDQLTYRELDVRARAIGAALQERGADGARVLVVCGPGLDGIAGVLGCWYAGAVAVPVPQRVGPWLSAVIADARPGFAVASPELPRSVRVAVEALAESVRWCCTAEGDAGAWAAPGVDSDSVALISYAAGSKHCPRGVVVTHENVMVNLDAMAAAGWGGSRDVAVCWLPTHHPVGLLGGVLATVHAGASAVLLSESAFVAQPMCWWEAISRWRATVTLAPEWAYRVCVQRSTPAQRAGLDVSSLSTAIVGTGPVRAATMAAFADAFAPAGFRAEAFVPVYGRPETTLLVCGGSDKAAPVVCHVDRAGLASGWALDTAPVDPEAVAVVGCGRPRQQVVIVDPDTRVQCGPDEVGEIWVWGAPRQTDRIFEAFLAGSGEGPFLRTGDRGFLRGGEVFVVGRCADLVVLGGLHYYPGELEAAVADCHAVLLTGRGVAFADESERLVIVHEVRCPPGETELAALVQVIQSALSESSGVQADSILLVSPMQLPSTEQGQIRRAACRWLYLDGDLDTVAQWHAPGVTQSTRAANVVEFTEGVIARRHRISHL
ncbi:AMP-binding protein [Mycolicibacter icosiumassiliensis]|uniref:AMP-binding protein n=1 Tax=Mycolicibacter icosiumassiliensis TaxID=1792835 RepID=UPI00098F060D|nr:AMP-binding protein [Mycolicibacter icosiumassiliensis]